MVFFFMGFSVDWVIYFSFFSMIVLFILLSISLMVIFFSGFYLSSDSEVSYFFVYLYIFILSMIGLINSKSASSLLLFWELLGLSSFFLILFYASWSSAIGALSTSLTMRFGDFFLLLFLAPFISIFYYVSVPLYSFFFIILISSKSAQFPFMGWLTRAMSAPTPVSSLVHSSTLVVSGWVLLYIVPLYTLTVFCWVLLLGVVSLVFSGILATYEEDYKKLVALSTLSQVSFCMVSYTVDAFTSFFHVLSHACTKSLLFMLLGVAIYNSMGQQDSRFLPSRCLSELHLFFLLLTMMSLCGLLWGSGVVSKEVVMMSVSFLDFGWVLWFMFFLGTFFTLLYCTRLWLGAYMLFGSSSSSLKNESVVVWLVILFFIMLFLPWLGFFGYFWGAHYNSFYFESYYMSIYYLMVLMSFVFLLEGLLFKSLFNLGRASSSIFDWVFLLFLVSAQWETLFGRFIIDVFNGISMMRTYSVFYLVEGFPFVALCVFFYFYSTMLVYWLKRNFEAVESYRGIFL